MSGLCGLSTSAMMSVLIAVKDEEEGLARTLASLVPAVVQGVLRDAIILDSGGHAAMAAIADAAGCRHLRGTPGEALGEAIAGAGASWMLMLRPGVVLEHDWYREAAEFVERADSPGGRQDVCATFSYASQRYGLSGRLGEAWRFMGANLLGRVSASQGLILRRKVIRRISANASPVPLPPRPPSGTRLVVLRAKAFVPDG